MRQIVYALQFTGHAAPCGTSTTILKATTTATSCRLTTTMTAEGVSGTIERAAGETAAFASTVTCSDDHTFVAEGTINFGTNGDRLRFRTVGQGYLHDSADPARKHGTVMWRVEGGEGQFAGASGLITSNFFVGVDGAVTDHHYGVIFLM